LGQRSPSAVFRAQLQISAGAIQIQLSIDECGMFALGDDDGIADVVLTLPSDAPAKLLLDQDALFASVKLSGSADLAECLAFVFRNWAGTSKKIWHPFWVTFRQDALPSPGHISGINCRTVLNGLPKILLNSRPKTQVYWHQSEKSAFFASRLTSFVMMLPVLKSV
jgi:hypothetical protein